MIPADAESKYEDKLQLLRFSAFDLMVRKREVETRVSGETRTLPERDNVLLLIRKLDVHAPRLPKAGRQLADLPQQLT